MYRLFRCRSISCTFSLSSSTFNIAQSTLQGESKWSTDFPIHGRKVSKEHVLVSTSKSFQCINILEVENQHHKESSYSGPHVAPLSLTPRVVIYDGVCRLCNAGVNWVISVDKDRLIKFCALQSQAAEPYLYICGLTREDVLQQFVFVEGPGKVHQASTAALKVASYLPLPYSTLSVFLLLPAPVRDALYDAVAARRYEWFGRSTECIVPAQDVLDRFIDREEMLEVLFREQCEDKQSDE